MVKSDVYRQTYLNLENELIQLSKLIYITDEGNASQLKVYSTYISDLIIRTNVEIEAILKELYFDLTKENRSNSKKLKYDQECLGQIDKKFKIRNKVVYLTSSFVNIYNDKYKIISPFNNTERMKSYQKLKHDRYDNLKEGSIINFIKSLSALFLLNIYLNYHPVIIRYFDLIKFDTSFGSKFFSVARPSSECIINTINGKVKTGDNIVSAESPFVCRCTEHSTKNIKINNEYRTNKAKEYLFSNTEFESTEFQTYINDKKANHPEEFNYLYNYILELHRFKLLKKIPENLPFETRKSLLANTDEWRIYTADSEEKFDLNNVNSENIDSVIDHVVNCYTIYRLRNLDLNLNFTLSRCECEILLDNGEI